MTYRKSAKRKGGSAKYRVESGRNTEVYRDASGRLVRRDTYYRRIVKNEKGEEK